MESLPEYICRSHSSQAKLFELKVFCVLRFGVLRNSCIEILPAPDGILMMGFLRDYGALMEAISVLLKVALSPSIMWGYRRKGPWAIFIRCCFDPGLLRFWSYGKLVAVYKLPHSWNFIMAAQMVQGCESKTFTCPPSADPPTEALGEIPLPSQGSLVHKGENTELARTDGHPNPDSLCRGPCCLCCMLKTWQWNVYPCQGKPERSPAFRLKTFGCAWSCFWALSACRAPGISRHINRI